MKPEKILVRESFARAAPRYDTVADYQREVGMRLLALCAELPAAESAPLRVLDAGCGTGHGLTLIGQRWPDAQTIALDFAEGMLRRLPPTLPPQALCGDMEALPLATATVDVVWSSLALQWCDSARVMGEFARVLRSNGCLVAATLGPATFAELRNAFAGVDGFRHTNDFLAEAVLRESVSQAGFVELRWQRVEIVRHFADLRSLLASVRELGANHVAPSRRRPGLMGKHAWRRFTENYEQMRTTQGLPLTYDSCFIVARKAASTPSTTSRASAT